MSKSENLIKFERLAAHFLEFENDYNEVPTENQNSYTVDLQKEEFKVLWEKVRISYETFVTDKTNADTEELCEEAKRLYRECRSAYITLAALMGELSKSFINKSVLSSTHCGTTSTNASNAAAARTSSHVLNLPRCKIEVFRGDYRSWPTFRDMFTAVYINCDELTDVQRLCYLRQFTSHDALDIVCDSEWTNEGFKGAWENLEDTYENKRILVNNQLKLLYGLSPVKSESAKDIKRLQREIKNCISVLTLNKVDIANWDAIFVFFCSINLPVLSLSLWEQPVKNKKEIPKWKNLDDFLTARYQSLETVFDLRNFEEVNLREKYSPETSTDRSLSGNTAQPNTGNKSHSGNRSSVRRVNAYQVKVNKRSCFLCSSDHLLRFCPTFLKLSAEERLAKVKSCNLCTNCLSNGHILSKCKSNFSCSKCKLKHHSMLHTDGPAFSPSVTGGDGPSTSKATGVSTTVQNYFIAANKEVILGTAYVNILCRGDVFTVRALIDPASQSTIISEKLQRGLNLPVRRVNAVVSGVVGPGSSKKECLFCLGSPIDSQFELQVEGLVLPELKGKLPNQTVDVSLDSLAGLKLADRNFSRSSPVDLIIGAEIFPKIMLLGAKQDVLGELMAQETVFGWILTGPLSGGEHTASKKCVSFFTEVSLDKQMERFWALEEPPRASKFTPEDEYCENLYSNTTKRDSDGRYIVSLPFKPQYSVDSGLGSSREKAQRQFLRNETSLYKNPELKSVYDEVLSEYESLGHMVKTNYQDSDYSRSFYLPHHAVYKPESSSTKVRVVFNASSRSSSGLSLNDVLYTGPILQNDLMLLIIRWRFYRYVFNGDIEKMYRQILLDPGQTKFQRIVFRKHNNEDLRDFELKTVTFGVNCAPFLAIRTLIQLASDVEEKWPLASKILRRMMYVDDALAGAHDVSMAIRARDQLILALSSAGFSMKKWTSNDERILQGLPPGHLLRQHFLEIDEESTAKTLGIRWNAKLDQFYFATSSIAVKEHFTKREVLSIIARLFDPAGWLGPIVIIAKMLMQQIWSEGTDWDEILSESAALKWKQFLEDYGYIDNIRISRWIGFKPSARLEVHGFSDASEKAYGACVYVRIQDDDGSIQSHLLLAKSKVAPLKTVSLPRLELCAASLLADLLDVIRKDLGFDETRTKFFAWSDSMIVLAWLQKPPKSWTTFVANRVSKIIERTGKDCWRHVSSNDNPADLISRGVRPQDLVENRLWWFGPTWLCSPSERWDSAPSMDFGTREEERVLRVFFSYFKSHCDLLERFSSYSRALRVMALVIRGINGILRIKEPGYDSLEITADEIRSVREKLIMVAQKVAFPDEYYRLSKGDPISGSRLLNLNPFLDDTGIMRVGGRLENAPNLTYSEKFPILLPSDCHFSLLLVNFIHRITMHGGNQLMLRVLRTEFFIPRAKNLIKTVIGRCKICTIQKKAVQSQIMAALPTSRTIISRPFTTTGVDFAGPFDIRNFTGRACLVTKGYVCVFVCFATKAIHLEAVSSLSTPAFLAAFSRFVARRGYPKDIHSDNGSNFVGASRELKAEFRTFLRSVGSEVSSSYAAQNVNWHFNPAGAPHMGGLWEAGVKSFKHHFRRIAGNLKYTFEEFSTLLARIESCLNSRPLCPLSENVECLDILTPGHFLIGGPLLSPPEVEILEAPLSMTNRWQRVKALNQRLCLRWKDEYLKDLQKRNKWKFLQKDLTVGDMVVIREDNLPTNEWRLGRVEKVHTGRDGHVRVVSLKTARGPITRPVVKLVVLPTY